MNEINLDQYLLSILGGDEKKELLEAVKVGKVIVVKGAQGTGKTTLVDVLNNIGCKAVEDFDTYEITLSKKIDRIVPNFKKFVIQRRY